MPRVGSQGGSCGSTSPRVVIAQKKRNRDCVDRIALTGVQVEDHKGSIRVVLRSTLVELCRDAAGTMESRDHEAVRLIVSYISLRRRCVLHPF